MRVNQDFIRYIIEETVRCIHTFLVQTQHHGVATATHVNNNVIFLLEREIDSLFLSIELQHVTY